MPYAITAGPLGNQQIAPYGLPDTTARAVPGLIVTAVDNFYGGGEFEYVKANGSIRQYGLVVVTPTLVSGQMVYNATEVPNTANLGRMVGVAMTAMTSGQFGYICIGGIVPVNCNAAVAADTTFGIAAAGQGGANGAGKQVLNARVVIASSTTVAKTGCTGTVGSNVLFVPNTAGWFAGAPISGTGIPASTTISDIDPSGQKVTLSANLTAAPGTVTVTYNDGTIFYNICHINRPFAQGAIT